MRFIGDIIITDPSYIVRSSNDWENCEYGRELSELGIKTFLTSDNGDMVGQSIKDCNSGEKLGTFCTDSGMVSVMLLPEVLAYNPEYSKRLSKNCYTIIKDFDGEVKRIDIENDDNQYWAFVGKGNVDFKTDIGDE